MKRILAIVFAGASLVAAAQPEITDLEVSQNSSRMVTISFSLSTNAIVTMDITTNGVSIGAENYQTLRDPYSTKDAFPANRAVKAGKHTWVWRPSKEWPGHHFHNSEFKVLVQAWSFDSPPDYMVIDSNVRSNAMFYAKVEDLPDGGLKAAIQTNEAQLAELKSDVYRTSKIVFRKIPAAGVKWRMGSPETETYRNSNETPHYVTLTNDYYVNVYLFTVTQAKRFFNTADANSISISTKWNMKYSALRGTTNSCSWPEDGHKVASDSFLANIRNLTGIDFDLLTEAEWEYACRAGTSGQWNDDGSSSAEVAWSKLSGGCRTYVPGGKKPNRWGLYDMHGLVNEWVLDQYGPYPSESVIAPAGVTTNGTMRILRGGPRNLTYKGEYTASVSTRSAYRCGYLYSKTYDTGSNGFGVRICCPASLPEWMRD